MKFFEKNKIWDELPSWVRLSIELGYKWRINQYNKRKIFLLSMPFDTPTAGLVALGAIRADLGAPEANNTDDHFNSIIQACKVSLSKQSNDTANSPNESPWDIRNTMDDSKWSFSEYDSQAGIVHIKDSRYKPFIKRKGKKIANPSGQCISSIFQYNSLKWQLKDHPVPVVEHTSQLPLDRQLYSNLGNFETEILNENLKASYDGIVLVTKSVDERSNYMKNLSLTGFIKNNISHSLPKLLTITSDFKHHIVRLKALSETKLVAEPHALSKLIIADGSKAFINAESKYPESDIVAIINRSGSAESLEIIRDWIATSERYYTNLVLDDSCIGNTPKGVIIKILERKN